MLLTSSSSRTCVASRRRRAVAAGCTFALLACAATAQAPTDRVVVRAHYADETQLARILPLLGHAQVSREKGLLRVDADAQLRKALVDAGLRVEIDADATAGLFQLAAAERRGMKSIPNYACYRTVEETDASMQSLAAAHPDLVEVVEIGDSWQRQAGSGGYRLKVVRATNRNAAGSKPKLFVMSSVHAREYTPAELATRFVEELVQGYGSDPEATWLLDHHEVHALLQANPDGRKRAETGLSWRKNTNSNHCGGGNSAGVDLNRNYPFEWGNWNGSSGSACSDTFRGPSPASEPETQAVTQYVRSQFDDTRGEPLSAPADVDTQGLFFDIHSYSRLVLWPWGFTATPAPNAAAFQALGRRLAWFNDYTPQAAVGLYPTDGTTDDFAYGELGLPAYTFELGTAFFQDCASFQNTILPHNRNALRYALRAARAPYRWPFGPDVHGLSVSPDLVLPGEGFTVSATADDARQKLGSFSESGPVPAVQAILGGIAGFVPPWTEGADGVALVADDGAFDAPVESVSASLDSNGLAVGRHLVWLQAVDAAGHAGPPAAAFVDVVAPEQVAQLSGRVRQVGTLAPLAATVRAGAYSTVTDPASGAYARRLLAGSYDIAVSAPGHEGMILSAQSAPGGASLVRDFVLYRLCPRLEDPVEVGAPTPFTAATPWTRRASGGSNGDGVWLQSASGNYANNLNASLTSPTLDLSGYTDPVLSFDQRCDTEATYDFGRVEVSVNNGASWSEVFRCDGETQWRRVELPLPQLAGIAQARVRFRFTSAARWWPAAGRWTTSCCSPVGRPVAPGRACRRSRSASSRRRRRASSPGSRRCCSGRRPARRAARWTWRTAAARPHWRSASWPAGSAASRRPAVGPSPCPVRPPTAAAAGTRRRSSRCCRGSHRSPTASNDPATVLALTPDQREGRAMRRAGRPTRSRKRLKT